MASSVDTAWCGLPLASQRHNVPLRRPHPRSGSRRLAQRHIELGSEIELFWEEDRSWQPAVVERLHKDGQFTVGFTKDGYEYHCIPNTWRMRAKPQENASANDPSDAVASAEPKPARKAPDEESGSTEEPGRLELSFTPQASKRPEPPPIAAPELAEEESPPVTAPPVAEPTSTGANPGAEESPPPPESLEEALPAAKPERSELSITPNHARRPEPLPVDSPPILEESASTEESQPVAASLGPDLARARSEPSVAPQQSKQPQPPAVAATELLEAPRISLAGLELGQKLRGRISKLLVYGALVNVRRGIQGLVHVSGMSTALSGKGSTGIVLQERQEVDVWVREVDHKRLRLGLALFNLWGFDAIAGRPDAWLSGTILSVDRETICVQAQLDNGDQAAGLVPVTEVGVGYVADPSAEYQVGQEVRVRVLRVDFEKFTLYLSMRPIADASALQPLSKKEWFLATVTGVTKYGMSVDAELESAGVPGLDKVSGLVHITETESGRRGVVDLISEVQVGQRVKVRLLSVDAKSGRVAFTMLEDFWSAFDKCTDWIAGKVTRKLPLGIYVFVRPPGAVDGMEGLVPLSEIKEKAAVGDTVQVRIVKVNKNKRMLELAMKGNNIHAGALPLHAPPAPTHAVAPETVGPTVAPAAKMEVFKSQQQWLQATVTKLYEDHLEVSVLRPDHAEPVPGVVPKDEIRQGVIASAKDEARVGDIVWVRVLQEETARQKAAYSTKARMDLSGFAAAAQQGHVLVGTVSGITPSCLTVIVPSPSGSMGAEGIVQATESGMALAGDAAVGQLIRVRVVRVMEDIGRLELSIAPQVA